jgi:hypothetical protein
MLCFKNPVDVRVYKANVFLDATKKRAGFDTEPPPGSCGQTPTAG